MEKRKIKDLKRGDYFTLTPVKEPNISQVWVRGEYIPQAKCLQYIQMGEHQS